MSFPTNPTTVNFPVANYYSKYLGLGISVLGSAFTNEAIPRRIDCLFCTTQFEFSALASAGANPAFDFEKFSTWMGLGRHLGHRITNLGTLSNAVIPGGPGGTGGTSGTAICYFCQDDNRICVDTLTP